MRSRASWRQMWRITLLVALIGGLLGSVALGALAAARRTDSAYGGTCAAVKPAMSWWTYRARIAQLITAIERAPGTALQRGLDRR